MNAKQRLIPIALIIITIASVYFLVDGRASVIREYNVFLERARYEAKNGVYTAAAEDYEEAMRIIPSLDVMLEEGAMYQQTGDYKAIQKFYQQTMLSAYPLEPATYAYGLRNEIAHGEYAEAFKIYRKYQKRELVSDEVESLIAPIMYAFEITGEYEDVGAFMVDSNSANVKVEDSWKYINRRGNIALSGNYEKVGYYLNYAPIVDNEGKAKYVDSKGVLYLPASYFEDQDPDFGTIKEFKYMMSGLVLATNGKTWNYYSPTTYQKLFGGFAKATVIANGVGAVSLDGDKWALIGPDGVLITDYIYDEVLTDWKDVVVRSEALVVRQGDAYFLVDKTGNKISGDYEDACPFIDSTFTAVKKNGKWIFVDAAGTEKDLGDFQEARGFSNNMAAVKIDGRWGYIDTNGNVVVEPQFYEAMPVTTAGVTFVRTTSDTWSLIQFYKENYDFL